VQLRHAAETEPATWISNLTFPEVTGFGPLGFEAYARLRFIPDPTRPGQSENDVELPKEHVSDLDQARQGSLTWPDARRRPSTATPAPGTAIPTSGCQSGPSRTPWFTFPTATIG
jgi:hypothetical protein